MSKNCDRKSKERRLGRRIAGAKKVRIKVRSLAENEMILFWKGKEHRQSAALVCLLWFMKFSSLECVTWGRKASGRSWDVRDALAHFSQLGSSRIPQESRLQ